LRVDRDRLKIRKGHGPQDESRKAVAIAIINSCAGIDIVDVLVVRLRKSVDDGLEQPWRIMSIGLRDWAYEF